MTGETDCQISMKTKRRHDSANRNEPAMIIRQAVDRAARSAFGAADKSRGTGTTRDPADEAETKHKEEQCRSGHKFNNAPLDPKVGIPPNQVPQ